MPFFRRRKYTTIRIKKKDLPGGLWQKCPSCNEIVYNQEIAEGKGVCPKCTYHFRMAWRDRIDMFIEPDTFEEWDAEVYSANPLSIEKYEEKVLEYSNKTGLNDAVVTGVGMLGTFKTALGVMDFAFFGGSMGSVVGEKVTRLIERATQERLPLVIVTATGGARMQEGMLSLMQMAKTSAALARHKQADLPYISILTHPSTAGVMASYATLGDVIVAEPGALVGFAGPRVIRETTREEVPPGFQSSEFVLKHGLVDMIVARSELKQTVISLLDYMNPVNKNQKTVPDTKT